MQFRTWRHLQLRLSLVGLWLTCARAMRAPTARCDEDHQATLHDSPCARDRLVGKGAALHKLGLERARVAAVATKAGQGADLRFERIPAAKVDLLKKAFGR